MRWHSIQKKTIGEYTVHLVARPDRASGVIVQRQTPKGMWNGLAKFPAAVPSDDTMQHAIAMWKYENLENEVDIENLIREWGDSDGDTLTELFEIQTQGVQEFGELPKVKKVRKKREKKPDPPYSWRNYPKPKEAKEDKIRLRPIDQYDHIVVSFSGGKDSVACALLLLEMGVPAERIELWHQAVDGEPGKAERFWDWPVTEAYCEAFAKAFGFKLLFQWKDGGYLGELLRHNAPTASSTFQLPNGRTMTAGGEAGNDTRLAYPAMGADLAKRWCSAYVKIDVAKKVFTNDPRFRNTKTLFITGERRQESTNRSKYENTKNYMDVTGTKAEKAAGSGREVHQWRAILSWYEKDVWDIMEKYRVRPHPAYWLGWSRVSCLPCIFGEYDQWAAVKEIAPKTFNRMAEMEHEFRQAALDFPEHTWSEHSQKERYKDTVAKAHAIRATAFPMFASGRDNEAVLEALKEKKLGKNQTENSMESLREEWESREPYKPEKFKLTIWDGNLRKGEPLPLAASMGESYVTPELQKYVKLGMGEHYNIPVILEDGETWEMPAGAGGDSGGPT